MGRKASDAKRKQATQACLKPLDDLIHTFLQSNAIRMRRLLACSPVVTPPDQSVWHQRASWNHARIPCNGGTLFQ